MKLASVTILFSLAAFSQANVGVIVKSEKLVEKKCAVLQGESQTVLEVTQRNFSSEVSPDGAVCKLNGLGCPGNSCFCDCGLSNCYYWALFLKRGSDKDWIYAKKGAEQTMIKKGDMIAWVWTQGNMRSTKTKPTHARWEDICAVSK